MPSSEVDGARGNPFDESPRSDDDDCGGESSSPTFLSSPVRTTGTSRGQKPADMLSPTETIVSMATSGGAGSLADGSFVPTQGFHDMMKRQAQHLLRTSENKKKKVEALTPSFQPEINERSTQILMQSGRGNFEQRLAMTLRSREANMAERARQQQQQDSMNPHHLDNNCRRIPTSAVSQFGGGAGDYHTDDEMDGSVVSYATAQGVLEGGRRGGGSQQRPQRRHSTNSGTPNAIATPVMDLHSMVGGGGGIGATGRGAGYGGQNNNSNNNNNAPLFRPAITSKGIASRPRSWSEMSIGDAMQREAAVRRIHQRKVEEEEKAFTGRPRMTRKAMQEGQSRLRMLSDGDSYTVRSTSSMTPRPDLLFWFLCSLFLPYYLRVAGTHIFVFLFFFLNENVLVIF